MSKRLKVMGEGGVHRHKLSSPEKTDKDGAHKHLFFVNDRLLMTSLSGEHSHSVLVKSNTINPEGSHKHKIQINTSEGLVEIETADAEEHMHEVQTGASTLSGLHVHMVKLGENTLLSLLPGDLVDAIESATKSVPALKEFKIKHDDDTPMEMNFQVVKRLNEGDFKPIMKAAVVRAHLKALSRMSEGLMIESLVLSRERYTDIGVARRFVMDHGMDVRSSEERETSYVFTVMSKDKFDEASLQRIRITDGVEAVVGFLTDGEIGQQATASEASSRSGVSQGTGADMLTENAKAPDPKPATVTSPSLDQFTDKSADLKKRLSKVRESFDIQPAAQAVAKSVAGPAKKFINWRTKEAVTGTTQAKLIEMAERHGITRKYVTVEYPQKRYVEFLTTNYEVVSAAYKDSGNAQKDEQVLEYASLVVKGTNLDAVLVEEGWTKSLCVFFDDWSELEKVFTSEIKNHGHGAYSFKNTMMGPILVPLEIDSKVKAILDEQMLANLTRDTDLFFSKETEDFFVKNAHKGLDYKRGILMYGPPGNGKTTFIKNFCKNFKGAYTVVCEAQDFSPEMGPFLKSSFEKSAPKIVVFEDVDAIASDYYMRSAFLNYMDGVNVAHKTLFLATTNYPGRLDTALLKRPSRFDQKYKIDLPNFEMRRKFLKSFFDDMSEADMDKYATLTKDFSGAMFKELFVLAMGLRHCSVDEAIISIKQQMEDIEKSAKKKSVTLESVVDILFRDTVLSAQSLKERVKALGGCYTDDFTARVNARMAAAQKDEPVQPEQDQGDSVKTKRFFEILKTNVKKRLITGPVLIPETVDLQDDIISVDEIERASHNYMIKLCFSHDPDFLKALGLNAKSKRGFMHVEFSRKLAVVETYCAPVDFILDGRAVKAGTWIMTMKVLDDEVWALVEAKKINGFSIGGRSKMRPEMVEG